MTTDYKVTELFCIIDEFCKHFDAENAGNLLEDNSGVKRRRRAASLSDSEIMTILLYFHFGTFRNFKHYYLFFIKGTMKSYFPKAVSYNRFVELESRVFFQLMFFLNLGAFGRCTGITFVDSTMIPVCHNLRRYANKVFKGIATDGKGTMGWCRHEYKSWQGFYGLRYGGSIVLDFFACISSIIAAYRFSVSWILRLRAFAFLLQFAVTVLYILASSVKTETSLSTYFSSS